MSFVQVHHANPARRPGLAGLAGLGQSVTCVEGIAVGGMFTMPTADTILITPDDEPGATYRLINRTPAHRNVQDIQAAVAKYYGNAKRMAASGVLLSNNDIIADGGSGSLGVNEFYARQSRGACPSWAVELYPPPSSPPPEPEAPALPDPFTAEQTASIHYNGTTRVVTVYAADGRTYTMDRANTPGPIAEELSTIAPQGQTLVINGHWNPAAGTVAVIDWYIQALGEGEKKYGLPDTGGIGPQEPGSPSTDWPGGLPVTDPRHPDYVPPDTGGSGGGGGGGGSGGGGGEGGAGGEGGTVQGLSQGAILALGAGLFLLLGNRKK